MLPLLPWRNRSKVPEPVQTEGGTEPAAWRIGASGHPVGGHRLRREVDSMDDLSFSLVVLLLIMYVVSIKIGD